MLKNRNYFLRFRFRFLKSYDYDSGSGFGSGSVFLYHKISLQQKIRILCLLP
jgi:hypothetical protein